MKIFTKKLTDEQCQYIDVICGHIFMVNIVLVVPLIFLHFKPTHWYGYIVSRGIIFAIAFHFFNWIYLRTHPEIRNYLWWQIFYFVFLSVCVPVFVVAVILR